MARTAPSLSGAVTSLNVELVKTLLATESVHQVDDQGNSLLIQVCQIDFRTRITDPTTRFNSTQIDAMQHKISLEDIITKSSNDLKKILISTRSFNPSEQAQVLAFFSAFGDLLRAQLEIVSALLQAGISINHQNAKGVTALHTASQHRLSPLVGFLISHGARADISDQAGNIALISLIQSLPTGTIACDRATLECATELVSTDCNISHKNNSGQSALSLAKSIKRLAIIVCNQKFERIMLRYMLCSPPLIRTKTMQREIERRETEATEKTRGASTPPVI